MRAINCHRRLGLAAVALALVSCATSRAMALDWRQPWIEPHDADAALTHSDEYAWRLFVALNWPAETSAHAPKASASFAAEGPVVWETWIGAGDVYLEHGADPGPWSSTRIPLTPERRFESLSRQQFSNLRHIVDGVMVPLLDPLASARRLTEIHMNRTAFEYIRLRALYSVEGQVRAYAEGADVSFPYGASEVKAKWRPISEGERPRYHTMEITFADGTQRLYGLTGLHIASKDLAHWFWATFEHVDNPTLADNEGWQLPSRDRFACGGAAADCNRAPAGIGLEGTVWQYYRLRGTLTSYVDSHGKPQRLANSELESGMQSTASCITCHARAAIGVRNGEAVRLPIFDAPDDSLDKDPLERRGFIGVPDAAWFDQGQGARFKPLDFVWSLTLAQSAR